MKKLKGMCIFFCRFHTYCCTSLFAAENDSLRKTLAVKDRAPATTAILRPERGASGTGFNLQVVMGLADDGETYAILRVSRPSAHIYLAHDL